jgi:hypothetical protein
MVDTRAAHQYNTLQLDLPSRLARLRALPPGHRVLSAYVDTSPGRLAREAYVLAFRDGCKVLRGRVAPGDTDAFEAAVEKAEDYLTQALPRHQRGLALFAVPGKDLFVIPLPKAPAEDVAWGELPEMAPLEQLLDDNPTCRARQLLRAHPWPRP